MPLQISIGNTEDGYVVVKNNIQPKIGIVPPSGYGLDLLKKRYDLLDIPQGVIIEQTPNQFSIKLKLVSG